VCNGIDIPTTNSYYDGGDPTLSSSYTKPLPKPSGDTASRACYTSAINNAGYVLATAPTAAYPVGWVLDTAPGSNTVTYDQDVPAIVSGGTDVPMALNNNAAPLIVGYASTSSGAQHAFVWTYGAATSTDLNTYAASLGATNLTGWVFTEADSINNNGEIVGYGTLNGVNHAFALLNYSGPGDANGDGKVDINDLTIVLANYNKTGVGWMQGCMDGDPTGTVDINDLTIVLADYGHTYSSSADSMAAVPEPGALALLAAALLALLAWARRRK
jgi:probable HAF family extracellular repeat protein